jgi:hypothetical protein
MRWAAGLTVSLAFLVSIPVTSAAQPSHAGSTSSPRLEAVPSISSELGDPAGFICAPVPSPLFTKEDSMTRRPILAALSTLLLLCGMDGLTAIANPEQASARISHATHTTVAPSTARAIVTRYFASLDQRGQAGHDEHTLNALYASSVTLVEGLTTGHPVLHTGRHQVQAFDQENVPSWYLDRTEQLSPSVVLAIALPEVTRLGQELTIPRRWLTLFTIRNGKIVSLVWMPC